MDDEEVEYSEYNKKKVNTKQIGIQPTGITSEGRGNTKVCVKRRANNEIQSENLQLNNNHGKSKTFYQVGGR